MNQSVLPDEIIIADDGSKEETTNLVNAWKKISKVPIFHIWHPDEGFRLSEIRNKAIINAHYPYIVQVDGDIILHPRFIEDHLISSHIGSFLCGSRVTLSPKISNKLLHQEIKLPSFFQIPLGFFFNNIRIPLFSKILAPRFRINKIERLRGCNMSFWKDDLLLVNGYNESITGWGPEDKELAVRLINAGVEKRSLKFLAVAYHLYHKETNKDNVASNRKLLNESFSNNIKWAENGIKKQYE